MKKVLFLDIDGVLNSITALAEGIELESSKILLLRRIVNETECDIVISSTWRKSRSIEWFKDVFQVLGFSWENCQHIIDVTPCANKNDDWFVDYDRGYEIQRWLDLHPKYKTFCIVDDDSDMLEHQLPYFVKTHSHVGLTTYTTDEIISVLK